MNVLRYEIKHRLKTMLILSFVLSLIIVLFGTLFPSFEQIGLSDMLTDILEELPPVVLSAVNLSSAVNFADMSQYIGYMLQYLVMAVLIYGTILGASALISEESFGTIEFLYAKPITRSKIVTMKVLASAVIYFATCLVMWGATTVSFYLVRSADVVFSDVFYDITIIYLGAFLAGIAFMAIGFLISTLLRSARQVVPVSLTIFFLTYLLGIISRISENYKFLKWFSPLDYVMPTEIVNNGILGFSLLLIACITVVGMLLTYLRYRRRDMKL